MSQQFEQLERLVERLAGRMTSLQRERDGAVADAASLKAQLQEKDLELIRARKEAQRSVEQLEREKMTLQKEQQQLEQRFGEMLSRIRGLLPEESPSAGGSRPGA